MKIKEVVYTTEHVTELLGLGVYNGYEYAIVSQGTHPCAYMRLPEDHYYYGKGYDEIPVDCHGGLSYSGECLDILPEISGWWIGWDYGHCDDYYADKYISAGGKKWTYFEIFEEVKKVIEQLDVINEAVDYIYLHSDVLSLEEVKSIGISLFMR